MTAGGVDDEVDVLVVGAGPTGSTLAIDLRRRGHGVRVVDRAPRAFDGSRAKGLQPRTLEVLEDLGALDDVLAAGSTYPPLGIHLGPLTLPWRMIAAGPPRPGVPYPNTWLIAQHRITDALHARLRIQDLEPEFDTELTELTPQPDGVLAHVRTVDGPRTVAARYVVGADGASSTVRRGAGVAFDGETDDADRMIIFDAVTENLGRHRWHIWPGVGGAFVGACPLPGSESFQWMIRLAATEATPDLDDRALAARVARRVGTRVGIDEIRWRSVFRPNVRLARAYRAGRVLLAGDAAHVHPPAGAQGLNTGVQDAYNLGWKLSQVLAGAPESLLDTYELERRPIAASVLGLSTRKYRGLGTLDPSSLTRGPDEQQLTLHYRSGPLAPSDPHDAEVVGAHGVHAGDRAPDARLRTADGTIRRLFEVFAGPHFTLLAAGPSALCALHDLRWPERGAPLVRVAIDGPGSPTPASSLVDHALADADREFAEVYGLTDDALLLVRPDGHLAAVVAPRHPASLHAVAGSVASTASGTPGQR